MKRAHHPNMFFCALVLLAVSTVVAGVATVLIGSTHRNWFGPDPLGEVLALLGAFTAWATYTLSFPVWLRRRRGMR